MINQNQKNYPVFKSGPVCLNSWMLLGWINFVDGRVTSQLKLGCQLLIIYVKNYDGIKGKMKLHVSVAI